MKVRLITATVTRDAMTRLPTTVPAHELDILMSTFGEDNVEITDEDAGEIEIDPAAEGERLAGKYGDGAVVKQFGDNFKSAVSKACSAHEVTSKAKAKDRAPA